MKQALTVERDMKQKALTAEENEENSLLLEVSGSLFHAKTHERYIMFPPTVKGSLRLPHKLFGFPVWTT